MKYRRPRGPSNQQVIVHLDGQKVKTRVVNVSDTGVLLSGLPVGLQGQTVVIEQTGQKVRCRVARETDDKTGLAFMGPVGPRMLGRLRGAAARGASPGHPALR